MKIGEALTQVFREERLHPETKYRLLGVKWYGKGVFLREEKCGREIKATKLYRVKEGDFIYNRLFAWKSSFAIIPEEFEGGMVSSEFPLFTCDKSKALPYYILSYILLPASITAVNNLSGGMSSVSRKRFKEKDFLNFTIPNYDIKIQERICCQIQESISILLTQEKESNHQHSLLDRLRQAILQESTDGKLTVEWRREHPELISGDNHASKLLERIKTEKERLVKEPKIKKEKPLAALTDNEKPFDLPEGWVWCRLGTCSTNKDEARQPISQLERQRRGKIFPYYGASGIIDKIDGFTHEGRNLLIGEDGANLLARSTSVAFIADGKYWVNNHAHVLGFLDESTLRFVEIFINAIDLKPYVTGGFQPKLSQRNLNRILVAFPPPHEQQVIIDRVDELMIVINDLQKQLSKRKEQSEMLMQSVLREAFDKDS